MHQVRYFLALARTLNFTRAAEECNVTQPSLTRAIRLLEHEFGGELLRRERGLTHLTPLGERMLPILTRCHDSAAQAKSVAAAMKTRKVAALGLALPGGVDLAPFLPHLLETMGAFAGLALRLRRGSGGAVEAALREGAADLAICAPQGMGWERFESWPLFDEPLSLVAPRTHRLALRETVALDELAGARFVLRRHCDTAAAVEAALTARGIDLGVAVEAGDDRDALALVEAGAGLAIAPASLRVPETLRAVTLAGAISGRELRVWAVRGRERAASVALLLSQLRAADWSGYRRAA